VRAGSARRLLSRAAKVAVDASPLVQGTAAATAAWVVADRVVDHEEPFFAPIAAVIALNAPLGERGLNAFRLLLGVGTGLPVRHRDRQYGARRGLRDRHPCAAERPRGAAPGARGVSADGAMRALRRVAPTLAA
jgi:hypothetical protein